MGKNDSENLITLNKQMKSDFNKNYFENSKLKNDKSLKKLQSFNKKQYLNKIDSNHSSKIINDKP